MILLLNNGLRSCTGIPKQKAGQVFLYKADNVGKQNVTLFSYIVSFVQEHLPYLQFRFGPGSSSYWSPLGGVLNHDLQARHPSKMLKHTSASAFCGMQISSSVSESLFD